MDSNSIRISDAHARVIQRARNLQNYADNDECYENDQLYNDLIETDPSDEDECEYLYIKPINNNCIPKQSQRKKIFGKKIPLPKKVNSSLSIKKNNNNTLRFNLSSSIFDPNFDSKRISKVSMVKNFDNSVDFIIKFSSDPAKQSKIPFNESASLSTKSYLR